MRTIVWCMSWWNSQEEFDARYDGRELYKTDPRTQTRIQQFDEAYAGKFGLKAWRENVLRWFPGAPCFIACGTWSEPSFSRFGADVQIVNAGAEPNHAYTGSWNYSMCAMTSAMAYALNRRDWDLLVFLDEDSLIGAVDWDALLTEFLARPEEIIGIEWCGLLGQILAWKRDAAIRFLHRRLRPNLAEADATGLALPENEMKAMFDGVCWYPWPHIHTVRQDYGLEGEAYVGRRDPIDQAWPFCRLPHPEIIEEYERTQTSQAKPLLHTGR